MRIQPFTGFIMVALSIASPGCVTSLVSCRQLKNNQAETNRLNEASNMETFSLIEKNRIQVKELLHFPWNEPEGLPKIMTGNPLTSLIDKGEADVEQVIAAYRFRINETGSKIITLASDSHSVAGHFSTIDFLLYNLESRLARKIIIPLGDNLIEKSETVDFLLGKNDSFYLLERLITKEKKTISRLRCVEASGKVVWEIEGKADPGNSETGAVLYGQCIALLKEMGESVYLQAETATQTVIFKVDSKTGETRKWLAIDNVVPKVFIDEHLNFRYATFIKEVNNRAYVCYNPNTAKQEILYADSKSYACLGFPAALDAGNNLYCAEGLSISCLSPRLLVKWKLSINNVILDSGRLFTSHFNEESKNLLICEWQENGSVVETMKVPLDLPGIRLGRLAGVVDPENFAIETYSQNNKMLQKYNIKAKTFDKLPEYSRIDKFHLQAAATWQIDKMGNIYLPVSSAEGFHIISVSVLP